MQKPNFKNKSFTRKQAFTLIELLIVIAIIGILFIVLVSKVDFATDKAKATGVQTDFRSFQLAFDTVAKENAGFNTFGWDTGDANQNGKRDSYDEGDNGAGGGIAQNGIQDGDEVFTGHKVYAETFTKVYSLKKNGTGSYDRDALNRLEAAINANLDPKLHITIKDDGEIVMANGAQDPWNKEYHGYYISNAENDKKDRGAIVMYSDGANNEFGSEHKIANGMVSISIPGNNKAGKDDYSIVSLYTYINGYGEVLNMTTGFSNNQTLLGGNNALNNGVQVQPETPEEPDDVVDPSLNPDDGTEPQTGDTYICGDYEYGYNIVYDSERQSWFQGGSMDGWHVRLLDKTKSSYGNILESINGKPIVNISNLYNGCTELTTAPKIPNSVTNMYAAFEGCTKLSSLPVIGENVESLQRAFYGCTNVTGTITVHAEATNYDSCFYGIDMSKISIDGNAEYVYKYKYVATGSNVFDVTMIGLDFASGIYVVGGQKNQYGKIAQPSAIYLPGDELPTLKNGDTYFYGDYIYTYNTYYDVDLKTWASDSINGWSVRVRDVNQASYGEILQSVRDKNITSLWATFYNCVNLVTVPQLPNTVTEMGYTFKNCINLTNVNIVMPNSISNIYEVFSGCSSLRGTITFNSNPSNILKCFYNVDMRNITLAGNATNKQEMANTGSYGSQVTIID